MLRRRFRREKRNIETPKKVDKPIPKNNRKEKPKPYIDRVISFLAAISTGYLLTTPVPTNAKTLKRIIISFPLGANQLVDVSVSRETLIRYPEAPGYFHLDNWTLPIEADVDVSSGGDLTIEVVNTDAIAPHRIPMIFQYEAK